MRKKQLESVATQASWFAKVRQAHSRELTEDYVELIAELAEVQDKVRLTDLSARLGVSNATANKVLLRLIEEGYVKSEPYRSVFLTEKGQKLADYCSQRHKLVVDFLVHIGVQPKAAKSDAEGVEHHLSKETLRAMCFLLRHPVFF